MCCFITSLFLFGPRAAIFIWWLFQPARWAATFDTLLWPLVGFLLLPPKVFAVQLFGQLPRFRTHGFVRRQQ